MKKVLLLVFMSALMSSLSHAASQKILPDFDNDFDQTFLQIGIEEHGFSEAQAVERLGNHYLQQGEGKDDKKAEICFAEAVKLDPTLYNSWFALGLIHMEKPEAYFKRVIALKPNHAQTHYWLASYYCRAEKNREAVKHFKTYLRVVDKTDKNESGRIDTAKFFIRSMEAGITGYKNITERQLSR